MCRACFIAALWLFPGGAVAQSVYFGNFHAHTSYSDGRGTPDGAYAMTRNAGPDFLIISEHVHRAGDGKGVRRAALIIATQQLLYSVHPPSLVEAAGLQRRTVMRCCVSREMPLQEKELADA